MNNLTIKVLVILLIEFTFLSTAQAHGDHSIPCSGPHKNDAGCEVDSLLVTTLTINRVAIDWLNETIIIGGENLSGTTTVTIAGMGATIGSLSATQLDIPFIALGQGNHNLVVGDGSSTDSISFYLKADMVDPTLTGCPCAGDWATELGGLWGPLVTDCLEVAPGGSGNPEDIAGTVLTDSTDPSVYPHYPIGAAFTDDPEKSVCQLTEVDGSTGLPLVNDLVKIRINRSQQGACRSELVSNICISPIPTTGL